MLRAASEMARMNTPSPPKLPVSVAANPKLSSWLKFSAEGHVTVSPGKVEIGQGIVTALAQIAADELDVDISRVQMHRASTAASPNEGVTSGSLSIQQSGRALRHVCAEVRHIFLAKASDRLGIDIDALNVEDGAIPGPGNVSTSFWELADGDFARSRGDGGRHAKGGNAANARRQLRAADRHSGQGVRATAFHSGLRAAGHAAWTGAATGTVARASWWS